MSSTALEKQIDTPYPLIDIDPHFNRVVRYFRPSDYGFWIGATAAFPALIYSWEMVEPSRAPRGVTPALRMTGALGFLGGFMLAYQRSSMRFWGWSENELERKRDFEELSERARAGKSLYGESDIPEYIQGVAHRNSAWSQLAFPVLPWFNFVNHPHHGVDTKKYYEGIEKEDK